MPRPGPRPYECVRRAWHSDRHQPMRGLIIQQLFRLVHERHTPAIKKNPEWQEKLPIVVLKAEEIMYSKANSEAEYMDTVTLWDRVNEAIDTIIRKDESTESGELLAPCVEAALNLGCVPVRASRSQRHANPMTYLKPARESSDASPKDIHERNQGTSSNWNLHSANASVMKKMPNRELPRTAPNKRMTPYTNNPIASSVPHDKLPSPANNRTQPVEFNSAQNVVSVYPLYYGSSFPSEVSRLSFHKGRSSDSIIVGVPVFSATDKPAAVRGIQKLFPSAPEVNATKVSTQVDSRDNNEKESQMGCDLSLRLGLSSESSFSQGKKSHGGTNIVPRDGSVSRDKEYNFFPVNSGNEDSSLHTSMWNSEVEGLHQNVEVVARKRKLPFTSYADNEQFFL